MAAEYTDYTYDSLPSHHWIRVIELLGYDHWGSLRCDEKPVDRRSPPTYSAFSYTWGSSTSPRWLIVNGKRLGIAPNCHYALSQAFSLYGPRQLYWIDSVCINQADKVEKAQQVGRMGEIYCKAQRTLSCIGPHENASEELFGILHQYEARISRHLSHSPNDRARVLMELGQPSLDFDIIAGAWQHLEKRVYWSRLWILQEIALSRNKCAVICGDDAVSLESMNDFRQLLLDIPQDPQTLRMSKILNSAHPGKDLISVLSVLRDSDCFNTLDRIYGLLAIVAWPQELPLLVADYTASRLNLALRCLPYLVAALLPGGGDMDASMDLCVALKLNERESGQVEAEYASLVRKCNSVRKTLVPRGSVTDTEWCLALRRAVAQVCFHET